MMAAKKRVAIIGAGASGLTAIKCCNDEGLEPVCLERTDRIGGLWHYTPDSVDGQACVMKSTVINTSKEMMCYSDFPIPKDYPNFMHNKKVLEYFIAYMKNFELEKSIRYKTEVLRVTKSADFANTGQWVLEIKDLKTLAVSKEDFDAVFVCTGHHAEKNIPNFEGLQNFKGKVVHTHDYKDHLGYEDKRVVVIGIGNSGGDVAVELGRVASQVYLSTRSGSWVLHRVGKNGVPIDLIGSTRFNEFIRATVPMSWINSLAEGEVHKKFDHHMYGLRPKYRLLSQHPMVNDDLPNRIICGSVMVKPNIKKVHESSVEFEDGSIVEDIDAIILATGYIFGFPYIQEGVIDVRENKVDLYKFVYPPNLEKPTMAVVGCIQPWGSIMPISELQCRWATKVFKGERTLPSESVMRQDILTKRQDMAERYNATQRHTIQVDYVPYMDELAEQLGCKPDIKRLILSDPALALQVFFSSTTPYQYRLHGPGSWPGARDAIMTQWQRVYHPLQTRKATKPQGNSMAFWVGMIVLIAILIKVFFF